jgi:hypothetical protein
MVKTEQSLSKCYSSLKNVSSVICFPCLSNKSEVKSSTSQRFLMIASDVSGMPLSKSWYVSNALLQHTSKLVHVLRPPLPHHQFLYCYLKKKMSSISWSAQRRRLSSVSTLSSDMNVTFIYLWTSSHMQGLISELLSSSLQGSDISQNLAFHHNFRFLTDGIPQ